MKTLIKQSAAVLAFLSIATTSPAIAEEGTVTCELGKTCDLELATQAIFPITESGSYVCEIEYFGTDMALQEHEAVLKAGDNTQFAAKELDIEGDKPTEVKAMLIAGFSGELVIESSEDTLYFGATAKCSRA